MTDLRVIDIADEPARLKVRYENLVVERAGKAPVSLPLAEIGALVVSHQQVTYTHAVLAGLAAAGAPLIVCDLKHLPVGLLLPIAAHYAQAERFAQQARVSRPTAKRLWQQIVRAKIRNQAELLERVRGGHHGLRPLVARVRSGDPTNVEAWAARKYWPALFDSTGFRRRYEADDANRLLNYGYAIIRALAARAICAAGLHPSLGIHHHNRYDAFCLADDLAEPFRPLVDEVVLALVEEHGDDVPLDRETKLAILRHLTGRFTVEGESRTLFDILAKVASSLAAVFADKEKRMWLPEM